MNKIFSKNIQSKEKSSLFHISPCITQGTRNNAVAFPFTVLMHIQSLLQMLPSRISTAYHTIH
uniref:Uncharacterized protein LOC105643409 isoform X1 n=1 Tax=Rhizophora mucronata TaxID=61149 RepID=A0A2P2JIU0_RHIMU